MSERAKAIAARFRLSTAGPDDPDVRACMERYLAARGLPLDSRSTADRWVCLSDGKEVVAVIGEKAHPGTRTVEISDIYPGPGRNGVLGIYAIMRILKRLVESGVLDCVFTASEVTNERINQALQRVFGVQPTAYVWSYGSVSPRQVAETTAQSIFGLERLKSTDVDEIFGVGTATIEHAIRSIFGRIDGGSET